MTGPTSCAWLVCTGAAWREVPAVYGAWIGPYRYYHRWTASGLWPRLLHALQEDEAERLLSLPS